MRKEEFAAIRNAMVDCQIRPSNVTKYPIIDSMLFVPRENFVPNSLRDLAYVGGHIELSENRVILDPRTFAKMLNELDVGAGETVLDVGSGLGYSAAVIARLAEAVVALEEIRELAVEAKERLLELGIHNSEVVQERLVRGAAEHGPYDVIVLEGGVEVLSGSLVEQLKDGGRIACIFVDGSVGECKIGIKQKDSVAWRSSFNAMAPVMPGFGRKEEFLF